MRARWLAGIAALAGAVTMAATGLSPAAPPRAEAYPPTQLERGLAVYANNCVRCHGPNGEGKPPGIPPHTGPRIRAKFATAADMATFIKRSMPLDKPGILSWDEVWAVTARILALNGLAADGKELNAQTAAQIRMADLGQQPAPPPASQPTAPAPQPSPSPPQPAQSPPQQPAPPPPPPPPQDLPARSELPGSPTQSSQPPADSQPARPPSPAPAPPPSAGAQPQPEPAPSPAPPPSPPPAASEYGYSGETMPTAGPANGENAPATGERVSAPRRSASETPGWLIGLAVLAAAVLGLTALGRRRSP